MQNTLPDFNLPSASQPGVMVIGRNCLDHIAVINSFPREDSKQPIEIRLIEGGGQGGTAACCIARLGGKPYLIGTLGDDAEGRFCLERLRVHGVDTRLINIAEASRTPVAYIIISRDSGKRTICYEPTRFYPIRINAPLRMLSGKVKAMLLAPDVTYLAEDLANKKPPEVAVIYDCERAYAGLEAMMAVADYFIPCLGFLTNDPLTADKSDFADRLWRLQEKVAGQLIVTGGCQGAFFTQGDDLYQVPALEVAVADTLGAGDNFHGAFALAVALGFDLVQCVKFSVAVASLSCRAHGGRSGLPQMPQALGAAELLAVRRVGRKR